MKLPNNVIPATCPPKPWRRWKTGILLILFAISFSANAFEYEEKLSDPVQEQQAQKIFKQLRCIVCDGESLAESNAEFSVDMRSLVREKLKAGKGEAEIMSFLNQRYGNAILQEPPIKNSTYFLWFAPVIFLIIGFFFIRRPKKLA